MKILIIRFSSIGDIVLTSPVIRCLKKQLPESSIHFVTKSQFLPLLEANPFLDKIHLLKQDLNELIRELKTEKFDLIIDLHKNLRSLRIKQILGVPSKSFDKLNPEKWLMVNFKFNFLPDKHIVDRYLETVKESGVENDGQGLDYFIPAPIIEKFKTPESKYIAWVLGATHNTKKYPVEQVISTCKMLNRKVILIGGKNEFEFAEQVKIEANTDIENMCGKLDLHQSALMLRDSMLVISNDTGMMHIAAAFKKPVVSLWGNTIPEFGMYPYYGKHLVSNAILEVKGLSCRPCSKIGYAKCPRGHFKCMKDIDPEMLVDTVRKVLERETK